MRGNPLALIEENSAKVRGSINARFIYLALRISILCFALEVFISITSFVLFSLADPLDKAKME
jgi:hypothetical protein